MMQDTPARPSWRLSLLLGWLFLTACTADLRPTSEPTAPAPDTPLRSEVILDGLGLVTALEFAPDGRLFLAEKTGQVSSLSIEGREAGPLRPILQLAVAGGNESGLLGLALAPDFERSHFVYLYYNVPNAEGKPIKSRIVRFREQNNRAVDETIIVDDLPASPDQQFHFGGGLTFGPDGKIYLIFGDRNMTAAARDPQQLAGSILRYNADGSIPADNPFVNSPVFAYGIRNGFGLAFDPHSGLLYETENGASCDDELNLILRGADYGWGVHAYDACPYPDDVGRQPLHQWPRVVAPADLLFYTAERLPEFSGDLLVCGHNESKLFHVRLTENGRAVREVRTVEVPGRSELCRVALAQGPDGWVYTTTADSLLRLGR